MDIGLNPDDLEALIQTTKEFDLTPQELGEALEFGVAIQCQAEREELNVDQRFVACVAAIGAIVSEESSIAASHARVLQVVQLLDGAVQAAAKGATIQ